MSEKYIGTESGHGLIGPVPEKPVKDDTIPAIAYWADMDLYNSKISDLSANPIPCEGWTAVPGRVYEEGVHFKLQWQVMTIGHPDMSMKWENTDKEDERAWTPERGGSITRQVAIPLTAPEDILTPEEFGAYVQDANVQPVTERGDIALYKVYKNDIVNSILSICLRELSPDQMIAMRDVLINRTPAAAPVQPVTERGDAANYFEKFPELAKEIKWFANNAGVPGRHWCNLLNQINIALQSQPTYPAEFVEWAVDNATYLGYSSWRFRRLVYTTAELFAGHYQEYIKSQSK